MTREEIGSILKQLRLETGKTQKEVAELLGRKQQIVGHWETGYSQPDANTLFTLCEIYGTTVDEAFGFKKESVNITKNDMALLESFHSLDAFGQETITYLLSREVQRTNQIKEDNFTYTPDNVRSIGYYQKLASAGTGQVLFDNIPTDSVQIPNDPKYNKVSYAIGVNGNSMEPYYHDGDMLLVEQVQKIEIGEIGIFVVDNEAFVKKLGEGKLISLNEDYNDIPLTEYSYCVGRVVDSLSQR